jgi:hypothetical protein
VPAYVPDAPTNVTATAGNAKAMISFTTPGNEGSLITSYAVTASPGGITAKGKKSPLVVKKLTNGTPYTFTVTATNKIGTGLPSDAAGPVTPATVPGAPTGVTATAGDSQATVNFSPPASDGGNAITGYTVTSYPGNIKAPGSSSPITVKGLTNGKIYTFKVTATNGVGTGPTSKPSGKVTPAAP